ncbi:PAS domain-containing sensor histidine kinase [Pontibacter harenae]|uniref:PAS domain-containing sensor histidine kinase n=1 Tax=Pontibacter harenae TaxID=2894083 RepID=UPI001E507C2A|nr:PAS domain-containing sensor histidine kinase [Pontibacter harenae]MCC9167434.1 PAS domain-containing sensor histidine kinase [Pontibacter harenae]
MTPDFYKAIVKNSSDMVAIFDQSGVYTYSSDSTEFILGYKPENLVGKSVFSLVHSEELAYTLATFEEVLRGKDLKMSYIRFQAKDGGWRWLDCVVTNLLGNEHVNGIVVNCRDVTEKVKRQRVSEESQAIYKSHFQNNPDAVFTLDLEGCFLTINPGTLEVTGYTEEEVVGTHFSFFVNDVYKALALATFQKALTGEAENIKLKITAKDGVVKDLALTIFPVMLHGLVHGVHGIAKDITFVQQADELIKQQAQKLDNVLGSISEAFFSINKEWRITYVNSVFSDFLGLPTPELLGQLICEKFPDLHHTLLLRQCEAAMCDGVGATFDEYLPNLNQTFNFTLYPSADGLAIYFRDVTLEKRAEKEIEKLSLVASKATNGIIITGATGDVEWANEGLSRLIGYSLYELQGLNPLKVLHGKRTDVNTVDAFNSCIAEGKPFSGELLHYKNTGEEVWFKFDVSPVFDETDKLVRFVIILTDITDRKKVEADLIQLKDDLHIQNRNLQQFTYITSHNLRAPVANLIGLTSLVKKLDSGSEAFKTVVEHISRSTLQLDSTLRDLNTMLAYTPAPSQSIIAREPVLVEGVLKEVLGTITPLHTTIGQDLTFSVTGEEKLYTNRTYLYGILLNLITNCVKFKSPARPLQVQVKLINTPAECRLEISDNGLGMDMEKASSHLFQLYKRFHQGIKGKGLGLFLVKTQVESLGGEICVESIVDVGTTFRLHFRDRH